MKCVQFVVVFLLYCFSRCNAFGIGSTLYCYQCISTHPGCGTPFEWLWNWSQACPETDDRCVKLIERKGAVEVITRDCLSSLKSSRTDIPADHYEGCRPATVDVKLANYVNNSIKELDIKKNYYDETTWCFCFLDNRCNGSVVTTGTSPIAVIISVLLAIYFVL
ncbi:UPAR/Ly6 domain-containing protein crim [Halyomorpha halys]|uniref:UPAR/Ly6 domain-containing protein crim n=1 Tax=Halyomorpha halys TaxID=286706 RepID=UPI0006D522FD|nr:uncharacterized protein LOC112211932 [Halyomorpha halys]